LGGETPSLLAALRFTRRARYTSIMSTFFQSLTGIAIAAVAVVLVLGDRRDDGRALFFATLTKQEARSAAGATGNPGSRRRAAKAR